MSVETGLAVDPLDLGDFGQDVEPPTFAPLALEFQEQLQDAHSGLAAAHGVLAAEALLDIGELLDDDVHTFSTAAAPAAGPAPLDDLLVAETLYTEARHELGLLANFAPPRPLGPAPGFGQVGTPT